MKTRSKQVSMASLSKKPLVISSKKKAIGYSLLIVLFLPFLFLIFFRPFVKVSVDLSSPLVISQFSPAITHVDNSLSFPWENNDQAAINNVKSLIKSGITYQNTPIMAWGVTDLWPDPAQPEPSNWKALDTRLRLMIDTGGVPVLTLNEAPWWMKGQLQRDGTTRLLSQSEEWSEIAFRARVLDNKMDDWLHLVQRVAERYMVAPYNVRYFQIWNELKGYYDPITNAYDYTTSPGNPDGPNAKHGYTYMYNQVYSRLMQVATSFGISTDSIKVGGPYVVMDTWSSKRQSNPSLIHKAYGIYDQRPLDVVQYWLQHKVGAGFITVDGSNENKDNVEIVDPFTAAEKFADITRWIRSLDNTVFPGAKTLPIWLAEWYAFPFTDSAAENFNDTVKSYTMIKFLKAGGAVAFSWGGLDNGVPGSGLWTATIRGGGQPLLWYYSYKAFKDYFSQGTQIYKTSVSDPNSVEALASAYRIMLVNKTTHIIIAIVQGKVVWLNPYQVSVVIL